MLELQWHHKQERHDTMWHQVQRATYLKFSFSEHWSNLLEKL